MQISATILLLAVVNEQVTGIIKTAFPGIRETWSQAVAMITGIVLCTSTQVGVLTELNVPIVYPIADYVITGLIISKGSNIIHDAAHGLTRYAKSRTTK